MKGRGIMEVDAKLATKQRESRELKRNGEFRLLEVMQCRVPALFLQVLLRGQTLSLGNLPEFWKEP